MIRILFLGLLCYIGYKIFVALTSRKPASSQPTEQRNSDETAHRDPVCGVYVSEENAVIGRHNGQRHFFCSMACLEKFREQLDQSSPT